LDELFRPGRGSIATSVHRLLELFDRFDDISSTAQVRPKCAKNENQQQAGKREYDNVFQDLS
jgi:hypothetical protein